MGAGNLAERGFDWAYGTVHHLLHAEHNVRNGLVAGVVGMLAVTTAGAGHEAIVERTAVINNFFTADATIYGGYDVSTDATTGIGITGLGGLSVHGASDARVWVGQNNAKIPFKYTGSDKTVHIDLSHTDPNKLFTYIVDLPAQTTEIDPPKNTGVMLPGDFLEQLLGASFAGYQIPWIGKAVEKNRNDSGSILAKFTMHALRDEAYKCAPLAYNLFDKENFIRANRKQILENIKKYNSRFDVKYVDIKMPDSIPVPPNPDAEAVKIFDKSRGGHIDTSGAGECKVTKDAKDHAEQLLKDKSGNGTSS